MSTEPQLTQIAEDLWAATHRVNAGAGVLFDSRMTVVRLGDGGLVLYSPIPMSDALAAELDGLGRVVHIIAPNGFHHLFAAKARSRFAGSQLWASRALDRKGLDLQPDHWLGEAELPFEAELAVFAIDGVPRGQEWDLLHRASKSLIVCDLVFHIQAPANFRTKLALWFAGASGGRLAQSRLWRSLAKDKAAARASIEALLSQDFTRLVPGHGEVIEGPNVRQRLRGSLWWVLGEKPS